jgi:hypothetical protein
VKHDAALIAANAAAGDVRGAQLQCQRTGLLALVYRNDSDDGMDGVAVTAGTTTNTDGNGIARFVPIDAGPYTVSAARADATRIFDTIASVQQTVAANHCPVVEIVVPVLARPTVRFVWKHAMATGVQDIPVSLSKDGATSALTATNAAGRAPWDGAAPLALGVYDVVATLDAIGPRQIFKDDALTAAPTVTLAAGVSEHVFALRKLETVNFVVSTRGVDGAFTKAAGATITVKWPDGLADRDFVTANDAGALAKLENVPAMNGDATTCQVVKVDVAGADVYEFLELTSE